MGKMQLETEDLILKKPAFEDWKDMYQNLWMHGESARFMLWSPTKSEEDAKERMQRSIEFQKTHLAWFVYEKKSSQAIGFAGMRELEPGVYEDTGVAFGPDFVGKGYGKQVVKAFLSYAFELGAKKFVLTCRSQNTPSKAVILSSGFRYTHSEEKIDPRNGEKYELEFYEIEL